MASHRRFYTDIMALHNEVTGSCILNVIKFPDGTTKKILVDCGLFQEAEYSELNKSLPFNSSAIDYVIVTHNHVDHTGRLPLLVKNGYLGKIITTHDTSVLIKSALYDSYKVLKSKAKLNNELPLYSEDDVELTLNLVEGQPFEQSIWLDNNIKLTFFMNGHLQGAAIALLQISYHDHFDKMRYENINLLFTGDYNNKNMFFDVKPVAKWVHQLPINIIQESTYGYMDSSEITNVFENNLLEAISKNKEIVIPVFSLGRSQEIMLLLKRMQTNGKLDKSIPIYYDGKLGMRYTRLFCSERLSIKEDCRDFLPDNLINVTSGDLREDIVKTEGCKILLTTSGMGSYGPAQYYLPAFLKKGNALIHFTGYLAEGTLGRKLLDSKDDDIVEVFGLKIKKRAEIKTTSEFSAHAKKDELLDFLRDFENIKFVLINHGTDESKDTYASAVVNEIDAKNVAILGRSFFYRLDGYGLIKPFTSKFDFEK